MRWLALLLLVPLAAGCGTRACNDNTLLVDVTLDAPAVPDALDVTVAFEGQTLHATISHTQTESKGTVEVQFPGGYPRGKTLTVTIAALRNGERIASGSGVIGLSASCERMSLTVSSSSGDGGVADLAGADLSGMEDGGEAHDMMPPPPDMTPVCPCLVFTTQPADVAYDVAFAVAVAYQNPWGTTETGQSGSIVLTLNNPGSATLSGTTTLPLVNGVASFADLSVDLIGAYSLHVAGVSLASDSDDFAVTPIMITTCAELQSMKNGLAESYALANDIDCSATANWNGGSGFEPVGDGTATFFTGSLDGQGHVITSLTIHRPSTDYIGLFGAVSGGATITDLALTDAEISGHYHVGGIVGRQVLGSVAGCHLTGSVAGLTWVGGLVGYQLAGGITGSYVSGAVSCSGGGEVGGLVGGLDGTATACHATSNVSGSDLIGGLVGRLSGSVVDSYATGTVSGNSQVGGLVGHLAGTGTITASYATGGVASQSDYAGGLVGYLDSGSVTTSHASGSVTSTGDYAGGLAGFASGSITMSYATGAVSGGAHVGGLVGYSSADIATSCATGIVSGVQGVGGLVGTELVHGVQNAYATGTVTGTQSVGGLIGATSGGGSVTNAYAIGSVTGNNQVGGLVGAQTGAVTACFATGMVTGTTAVGGLVGEQLSGAIANSAWLFRDGGPAVCFPWSEVGCTKIMSPDDVTYFYNANTGGAGDVPMKLWSYSELAWSADCNGVGFPPLAWQILTGTFDCHHD